MSLIFDGVKVGLILCFMIGPIFFALIQTGMEEGFRAGAMMGLGIWLSDLAFILVAYSGVAFIGRLLEGRVFPVVMGLVGSVLLIGFGLVAILRRPNFRYYRLPQTHRTSSYLTLWLKGFLLNSVNPFTIFFWLGLMSAVILKNSDANLHDSLYFFSGVIGIIVMTDIAKILLAKRIRRILRPRRLLWLRRISGGALILFGLTLLVRALMIYWPG
jgi:threonine/homoserine/homoserine lactone efflux protein